jgi:hypothetical protein
LTGTGVTISAPEFPAFNGVVASFTDADPNGVIGDYSATINWGDGITTAATSITANAGGRGFLVHGTHQYAADGV